MASANSASTFEWGHKSLQQEEYRWSMLAYISQASAKPFEDMAALNASAAPNVSGSPEEEEPIDKIEVHLSSLKAEQAEKEGFVEEEVRRLENCLEKVQTVHEAHVGNCAVTEEDLTAASEAKPESKFVEAEVATSRRARKAAKKAAKKAEKAKQAEASKEAQAANADVTEVEAAKVEMPEVEAADEAFSTSGASDSASTFESAHKSLEKEEYRWSMLAYQFKAAQKPFEEMAALKAPAALNVSGSPKEEEPIDKIEVHHSSLKDEQAEKEEVRRLENCLEKADVEKTESMQVQTVHEARVGNCAVTEEDLTAASTEATEDEETQETKPESKPAEAFRAVAKRH